jgi:hypothetical protein
MDFVPALGSRGLKYWFNVHDNDVAYVGKSDDEKSHQEFALENAERFDIDPEVVDDDVVSDIAFNGYSDKLIFELLKLGWVRIEYNEHALNLEAKSERDAHKAMRAINSVLLMPFTTITIDIRTGAGSSDYQSSSLTGARLDFFIKRGSIPTGMVQETKQARK